MCWFRPCNHCSGGLCDIWHEGGSLNSPSPPPLSPFSYHHPSSDFLQLQDRVNLPPHLLGHPVEFFPDLLPVDVSKELVNLIKEMKEFPTNANDRKVFSFKHRS